ncbi:hypothetical protein PENTCL1PPCAC_14142, partial [Pristionchus entomophagus]
ATFLDMCLQWVFDPAYLIPPFCVYRKAPLLNIPVSANFCLSFMFSLTACGGQVYLALFMYRHQAIALPGSRFKFSIRAQISFIAVCLIPCILLGPSLYVRSQLQQYLHIHYFQRLTDEWDAEVAERIDCFATKELIMYPYVALVSAVPVLTGLCIAAIARHTFHLLRKVKHISVKTQNLHRSLTRSLVAQALVPVLIVILPFCATNLVAVIKSLFYAQGASDWAIDTSDLTTLAVSFHSTAHSITFLLTTPTFRQKLYEL